MSNQRGPDTKPDDPKKAAQRPPTQSLIDEERSDWEGMGQSRHQPEIPPVDPKAAGKKQK